jgi:vacuolar-type H+-ATPase subunit E/Vma4
MSPQNLVGNGQESLESFKRALQEEYGRKLEALKERFEQDFSALIAARRLEVEKKVQQIRLEQNVEFESEVARERQSSFRELRTRVLDVIVQATDRLDEEVSKRIDTLRANPKDYASVFNHLAREALDSLAAPQAILRVGTGEANLVAPDPRIFRIEETADLSMGGCVVVEAKDGTHLVDNTLRTRWERLKPMTVEKLSLRIATLVDDVQQPFPELRLP